MQYTVEKHFTHDGEQYEVRSWVEEDSTIVKAFKQDGTLANPYKFSVTNEIQLDAKVAQDNGDPLEELIKTAEEYVTSDTWGKYLKAVEALEDGGE